MACAPARTWGKAKVAVSNLVALESAEKAALALGMLTAELDDFLAHALTTQ
jgi:hypothetical protein